MKFLHFKPLSKRTVILAAGVFIALIGLIAIPAVTKAGYGPGRETKAYYDGVPGFDHVTFNSFTGVPGIGDERQFFNGHYSDAGSVYSDPMPQVKNGDVLTLQVYVHNNADESLNASGAGIARNTKVRVVLPEGIAKAQEATAYISADNAQPQTVYDTLDFGAANGGSFQMEYVPGSAHLKGNFTDVSLPDSIVTTGAAIGTRGADGNMEGCYKQMVYVTLQVKVKMPQYSLTKQVRMNGQTSADWTETKNVKAGDTTQWLLTFKNTGSTALSAVNIVDKVPAGMTVVPGSVKLINGNYPSGYVYGSNAIQDNGRTINIKIGDYNPDAAGIAYVIFDTTIDKPAADVCSAKTLVNKAYATPSGFGAIWDTASVTVPGNVCEQPKTPVYSCDLIDLTKGDRQVTVNLTKYTALNGASLKMVTYNFGDGKTLTTDKLSATHKYTDYGTYNVSATLTFRVNDKDVTGVTSESCAASVTFTTPQTPETPPELPDTGAGSVIGIFGVVSVLGAIGYRLFLGRKFAR